jgi:crotonobetainyl-CoA:carnitine CoA-transferase CaiB-like acyl-CoA transferase
MGVAREQRWRQRLEAESDAITRQQREAEVADRVRRLGVVTRPVPPPPSPTRADRSAMRRWMRLHADEHEGATALAEAASAAFDLPEDWLDDPTHWVWDMAAEETEARGGNR